MYRIKTPDGTNKYDIDSIMNEHLFYSKLVFNEMGGSAHVSANRLSKLGQVVFKFLILTLNFHVLEISAYFLFM
jgi:hypothetical protein